MLVKYLVPQQTRPIVLRRPHRLGSVKTSTFPPSMQQIIR